MMIGAKSGGLAWDRARMFAEGAYRRAADVTAAVRDFAAIGVDEYVFIPTMAGLDQVDRLADAALAPGGRAGRGANPKALR